MNKKLLLLTSIALLAAVIVCVVLVSLAWYSNEYEGAQSLDFAVFSDAEESIDTNGTNFMADFRPARAYEGAVAAGLDVSAIFSDPFYYSEDQTVFTKATSQQLYARMALMQYDPDAEAFADRYTMATTDSLVQERDNLVAESATTSTNIYYRNGMDYVPATLDQINAGLNVYCKVAGAYSPADKDYFESSSYIDTKAQVGVIELRLAYRGTGEDEGTMDVSCQLSSKWPNAPSDEEIIVSGGGEDRTIWLKDIGDEVSYVVCVAGLGYVPDESLEMSNLPATTIVALNESQTGYEDFSLSSIGDGAFLLESNLDHDTLLNYFGINTYCIPVGVVTYGDENQAPTFDFDESWVDDGWGYSANEQPIDEAGNYAEDSFHGNAFSAANRVRAGDAVEFVYNGIRYAAERFTSDPTKCRIVQVSQGIGKIGTSTTMNLRFYVFMWYKQVDELLSPNVTFGEVNLTISMKKTGTGE